MSKMDMYIDGLIHPIRGHVFDEDILVDIRKFSITNEKENNFVSTYKDREFCLQDFLYLIVPSKVMEGIIKTIIDEAYEQGFEDGRKNKKKPKATEDTES